VVRIEDPEQTVETHRMRFTRGPSEEADRSGERGENGGHGGSAGGERISLERKWQ